MKDTKQKDVQTNTPHFKTNYYVLGILLVLGSEFILRAVLLPKQANGFDVGLVLIIEWVVLAMLMAVWLPRVEKLPLASSGGGWALLTLAVGRLAF